MNPEQAEHEMRKARFRILEKSEYFSFLVLHLDFEPEEDIPTMGVDGSTSLYYSPEFVAGLTLEEIQGCLIHEVLHNGLQHHDRFIELDEDEENAVNHHTANAAADLCINWIISQEEYELPVDSDMIPDSNGRAELEMPLDIDNIVIKNIGEKNMETVYRELLREVEERPKMEKVVGKLEEKEFDDHNAGSQQGESVEEIDAEGQEGEMGEWGERMVDAAAKAQAAGENPAGLDRMVDEVTKSKVDWKRRLNRFINQGQSCKYTWSKPNRRVKTHYAPTVEKEKLQVAVGVDTSGSISEEEIKTFLGEIDGVMTAHQNVEILLVTCDAKVQNKFRFSNKENRSVVKKFEEEGGISGGGGTQFGPVFEEVEDTSFESDLLIYLTDGYPRDWPDKQDAPTREVMWLVTDLPTEEVAWGEAVQLEV